MADTTADRQRLAILVRELERQLKENRDTVFKPLFAHPDHVIHYYQSYKDYLARALSFPELPQRDTFEARRASPLIIHRDNLGSLAGRIGELAAALEASTVDVLLELKTAQADVSRLTTEIGQLRASERSSRSELRDAKRTAYGLAVAVCVLWIAVFVMFGIQILLISSVPSQLGIPLFAALLFVPPLAILSLVRKMIGLPSYLEALRTALQSLQGRG